MPRHTLTACSCPGCDACGDRCPEPVPNGRCDECKRARDRARGSGTARGYTRRWAAFSKQYLHEHPVCQCGPDCCPEGCSAPATDVDHADGTGRTGPRAFDRTNLVALAHGCHSRKTVRADGGFGR